MKARVRVYISGMVQGVFFRYETKKRALDLLKFIGIEDVKNNLANNMSGGQQQRTAIART